MLKRTGIILSAIMVLSVLSAIPGETEAKPPGAATWEVPGDFDTIQDAIDSDLVSDGDRIMVGPGEWFGATVTKAVEIKGTGGAVIVDGPAHSSGWLHFGFQLGYGAGGDGATISHFTFDCGAPSYTTPALVFPVFSFDADDVTVEHCTMNGALQGVTNWEGDGWTVEHNTLNGLATRNGGGIGIFCGSYSGATADDSTIRYNTVTGTLEVHAEDKGGYGGSGIVLYADYRWGKQGAEEITGNEISHNRISMISDNPDVVDFNAIELTESRDDPELEPVIFENTIEKNDMRGSANGILLTPEDLGDCNDISQNKF